MYRFSIIMTDDIVVAVGGIGVINISGNFVVVAAICAAFTLTNFLVVALIVIGVVVICTAFALTFCVAVVG